MRNDRFSENPSLPSSHFSDSAESAAFGGFAGMVSGFLAGVASYSIVGADDPWRDGGIIGAIFGSLLGLFIGKMERSRTATTAESNIATHIGVLCGLIPGCLLLLGGIGMIRGKVSGLAAIGAFFAGPAAGLFIGGILDRMYEARLQSRKRKIQAERIERDIESGKGVMEE